MADLATNYTQLTAEWIRRPLADLGGLSPQDAATDPLGRKKLEDLFTELAGHHVRLTNLGLPALDPNELRHALGIEATAHAPHARHVTRSVRMGPVKRSALLDELGTALTGGDVDSVAFFNAKTGAIEHFMHNLGDQETARIAEAQANTDMRKVTPVTTDVRYGIMSDFIGLVEDITVAGRLRSSISGKGAFRRFREAVDEDDGLRRRWLAYRTKRHYLLALDWLHKLGLTPEQFNLNPADYDWQPPSEEAERTAPAETPAEQKADATGEEQPSETHAASNGEAAEEQQAATEEPKVETEPQPSV
jgi:hypothetical protein